MAEAEGQRLLQAAFESQPHTQRPLGSFPPASGSRLLAGKMKGICEEAGAFVTPLTPGSPFQGPRGRPRWLSCGKADLRVTFTFHFHALEKEMATHSSILAWRSSMDRGVWQATVHGVAKSRTQLSN